jgi:hypothetical protein
VLRFGSIDGIALLAYRFPLLSPIRQVERSVDYASHATGIGRTVALTVGLLISGVGATAAMAQGAPGALTQILALLQELQTSVNTVQQSVNALGASNNFLFTPVVIVESGIIDCNHVNVTNEDRHVLTELINAGTGAVVASGSGTIPTPPGRSRGVGAVAPLGFNGTGFCKFTVLDGTKADIRANLALTQNTAGDETTAVSVAAE